MSNISAQPPTSTNVSLSIALASKSPLIFSFSTVSTAIWRRFVSAFGSSPSPISNFSSSSWHQQVQRRLSPTLPALQQQQTTASDGVPTHSHALSDEKDRL
jgi:hypothetical protein